MEDQEAESQKHCVWTGTKEQATDARVGYNKRQS